MPKLPQLITPTLAAIHKSLEPIRQIGKAWAFRRVKSARNANAPYGLHSGAPALKSVSDGNKSAYSSAVISKRSAFWRSYALRA